MILFRFRFTSKHDTLKAATLACLLILKAQLSLNFMYPTSLPRSAHASFVALFKSLARLFVPNCKSKRSWLSYIAIPTNDLNSALKVSSSGWSSTALGGVEVEEALHRVFFGPSAVRHQAQSQEKQHWHGKFPTTRQPPRATSRTKCISLSSTEAEWYAATSAVCDSLFLHDILSFLIDDKLESVMLHTDNSALKMLSNKLGAGRLRHIKGRLLWLQAKVLSGDLNIRQVKTLHNIADLNTKI